MDRFLFLHAHPDDESIFTGGTLALLAASGADCTVVVATTGDTDNATSVEGSIGAIRADETVRACRALGVDRVEFLPFADSGIDPGRVDLPGFALANADVDDAAEMVATIARKVGADALVTYDEGGIYAHADHLMTHAIGRRAAELVGVGSTYEVTVDREYLHFVDTHLVDTAALSLHDGPPTGVATVLISTTVDVGEMIEAKYRAMSAHVSQMPNEVLNLKRDTFQAVYGYEWFIRHGPPTALDRLGI